LGGADGNLTLLYAGNAGRKDLLSEFIYALAALTREERARIKFILLGPSHKDLCELVVGGSELLDSLGSCVQAKGRVSRSEVLSMLRKSDFSVLLRPSLRYSRAGFPSKIAESLAAGTPVLVNLTSDLADYIADGAEGVVVPDCSIDSLVLSIRRTLTMPLEQKAAMRMAARRRAEESFHYRNYLPLLGAILDEGGGTSDLDQKTSPASY
jgi:glycosyltransferase involved in cell wall biosynthesis